MLIFVVFGIFADVIAPGDPGETNVLQRLDRPAFDGGSGEHLLGTDHIGRDIWTRIVHGARVSLIVIVIVVPCAAIFGTTVGMLAGWRSGKVGQLLMRYVDVQLAMPAILFAVLLGAVLGASPTKCDHHPVGLDLDGIRPTGARRSALAQRARVCCCVIGRRR